MKLLYISAAVLSCVSALPHSYANSAQPYGVLKARSGRAPASGSLDVESKNTKLRNIPVFDRKSAEPPTAEERDKEVVYKGDGKRVMGGDITKDANNGGTWQERTQKSKRSVILEARSGRAPESGNLDVVSKAPKLKNLPVYEDAPVYDDAIDGVSKSTPLKPNQDGREVGNDLTHMINVGYRENNGVEADRNAQ